MITPQQNINYEVGALKEDPRSQELECLYGNDPFSLLKRERVGKEWVFPHDPFSSMYYSKKLNYRTYGIERIPPPVRNIGTLRIPYSLGKSDLTGTNVNWSDVNKFIDALVNVRAEEMSKHIVKSWWSSLSIFEKIRGHPRVFLSTVTFTAFAFTIFCVLSGLLLNRLIIAPDFAVVISIISFFFWLMTLFSK